MEIGILGAGSVGQAFAKLALHSGHHIKISNSRGPASLTDLMQKLGPRATAATSEEAAQCEMVLLAIPWDDVPKTLSSFGDWGSRILIDATNPYHGRHGAFTLADVGNLSTSQFVAQLASGAKVVKAINHMIMSNFEAGGDANGAKRVAFVAGDDSFALHRGYEHQRSMRRWNARDGRPHCFGGAQRGSGPGNDSRACMVQPWSVIPAALAGVVFWTAWRRS